MHVSWRNGPDAPVIVRLPLPGSLEGASCGMKMASSGGKCFQKWKLIPTFETPITRLQGWQVPVTYQNPWHLWSSNLGGRGLHFFCLMILYLISHLKKSNANVWRCFDNLCQSVRRPIGYTVLLCLLYPIDHCKDMWKTTTFGKILKQKLLTYKWKAVNYLRDSCLHRLLNYGNSK